VTSNPNQELRLPLGEKIYTDISKVPISLKSAPNYNQEAFLSKCQENPPDAEFLKGRDRDVVIIMADDARDLMIAKPPKLD
jgi:hypothetical protein